MEKSETIHSRVRSGLGRIFREAILFPPIIKARCMGRKPRLAVLPSSSREASSLLRGYNISEKIKEFGWESIVIEKHLSLRQRNRILNIFKPDIIIVQKTRHLLNRAEYLNKWPIILDLDDADFLDPNMSSLEDMLDVASGVICGSKYISDWARHHHDIPTKIIWTGNVIFSGPWLDQSERAPIVTWAQSNPIAYSSILDYVIDICVRTAKLGSPKFKLRLYNWTSDINDPRLEALRNAGIDVELIPMLPYDQFILSLRDVAVGLSPLIFKGENDFNRGKSFGKILGYLDAKVPVICSDAADHADFFTLNSGIVSNDPDVWAKSIADLLTHPEKRQNMSEAAHASYTEKLSIFSAAKETDIFLRSFLSSSHHGSAP